MTTVCHLWPAISPHGPEVPNSIWNLPYGVWLGLAAHTDAYLAQLAQQSRG
jgi:hypothetical protein